MIAIINIQWNIKNSNHHTQNQKINGPLSNLIIIYIVITIALDDVIAIVEH